MSETRLARILGVDPSLRGTGYGLIEPNGRRYRALTFGTLTNPASLTLSRCLLEIRSKMASLIDEWQPQVMAIESTIYVQSYRTAITLGAARGAAILTAAERGVEVFEYAPRKIKQAIVGRGAAQKEQVSFMIRALLELTATPASDAADALAVALAHAQAAEAAIHRREPLTRI